jgi:hypothetical protein
LYIHLIIVQVDPLKLNTYGVKKPFEDKAEKIKDLINSNNRYYPVDRSGKIDEWGAVLKQ